MKLLSFSLLAFALAVNVAAGALAGGKVGKATVGGNVSPDGRFEVTCDLPVDLRTKNVGGTDRAGLCVFSSVGHSARYQNETLLWDFQQKMRQEPGGGWPQKLEQMIEKYGKGTKYEEYLGTNPMFLEAALRSGRMPAVTYTRWHMVNLLFLNDQWAAVLDNNFVGEREIRWHPREEFLRLWTDGGQGWAVVLLAPRPAPPPHN